MRRLRRDYYLETGLRCQLSDANRTIKIISRDAERRREKVFPRRADKTSNVVEISAARLDTVPLLCSSLCVNSNNVSRA